VSIAERASGTVKWFSDDKGYGFLIANGHPKDIFVHRQQLARSGIEKLVEGERVNFLISEGKKGLFATSVSRG
jgi:CspA family cold shock protein